MEKFDQSLPNSNDPEKDKKIQKTTDEWESAFLFSLESGFSSKTINKIVAPYRKTNPEYFSGSKYSPELTTIIREKLQNIKEVPDGWSDVKNLASEYGPDIWKLTKKYQKTHPEYFSDFKNKDGDVYQYADPEFVKIISNEIENLGDYPLPPEGWNTNATLSKELGSHFETISKKASPYRKSHPQYFNKFTENGRVFEYYAPELAEIIKKDISEKNKDIIEAPHGWRTSNSLCVELSTNGNFIGKIIKKYRASNPEYFAKYKIEKGQVREHYSPELVSIINDEVQQFKKTPEAPTGWKTITALSEELGLNYITVGKIAKKYIQNSPEDVKWFKTKSGRSLEHYSPELIKTITRHIESTAWAPIGWKTKLALSRDLLVSVDFIKRVINKYKVEANQDYFKEYRDANGGDIREHYSPKFIEILRNEVEKFKDIPEALDGWLTNRSLSPELNIHKSTLKNIADQYRAKNPEYFQLFKMKDKQVAEHYSPELVSILRGEIGKFPKVGKEHEGWKTKNTLSTELGIDPTTVGKIAYKYTESNPEYLISLRVPTGRIVDHYSPELVEIIRNEAKEKYTEKNKNITNAPENWKTKEDLAQETGLSIEDINRAAAKLKKEFPDKFGKFKSKE